MYSGAPKFKCISFHHTILTDTYHTNMYTIQCIGYEHTLQIIVVLIPFQYDRNIMSNLRVK